MEEILHHRTKALRTHNTKLLGARTILYKSNTGSLERGYRGIYRDVWGLYKGPRTQIIGFEAQILEYQWYLGPKHLLFASSDL